MVFVFMAEETNRIATSWRQRKDAQAMEDMQHFSSGKREIKAEPADPSPRKNNSPKIKHGHRQRIEIGEEYLYYYISLYIPLKNPPNIFHPRIPTIP